MAADDAKMTAPFQSPPLQPAGRLPLVLQRLYNSKAAHQASTEDSVIFPAKATEDPVAFTANAGSRQYSWARASAVHRPECALPLLSMMYSARLRS